MIREALARAWAILVYGSLTLGVCFILALVALQVVGLLCVAWDSFRYGRRGS